MTKRRYLENCPSINTKVAKSTVVNWFQFSAPALVAHELSELRRKRGIIDMEDFGFLERFAQPLKVIGLIASNSEIQTEKLRPLTSYVRPDVAGLSVESNTAISAHRNHRGLLD